jgi:diguanylate cyclase (GGDEF)-like protein
MNDRAEAEPADDRRPVQLLCIGAPPRPDPGSRWGPFTIVDAGDVAAAARRLAQAPADALLWAASPAAAQAALGPEGPLAGVARRLAVVIVAPGGLDDDDDATDRARSLVELGVQDVLPSGSATPPAVARTIGLALQRQQRDARLRASHQTDLATGLPTHAQLLEHMTHLLALREREPAPMALIVLQVDGLAPAVGRAGSEAMAVLRRKVAVRLRAALRASDVVASIGDDRFAVLLAWMDAPDAGPRVAAKLCASLRQPFQIGGHAQRVTVHAGLAAYPGQGRDADSLMARALAQASSSATTGGTQNGERGASRRPAATDD